MIPTGVDLSRAAWRKSAHSGGNGACVEVATLSEAIAVRDSRDPNGPTLIFDRNAWRAFSIRAKNGQFDG